MPRPRIGSLCSGAGGLDIAVEYVTGGQTIWHAECDDDASKVLATRWPGVPNHRDITATDWMDVAPIDIVTAGYPCQPFSAAGQRKGTDDERHLWPFVAEAIRVLRPRLVVLENVAGHRSLGFDCVLADLAGMRYDAQWCSLRASDVGATHQRNRLFVAAHPAGLRWDQGWPESAGVIGRSDAAFGGDEADGIDLLRTPTVSRYGSNQSRSPGAAVRPGLDSIADLLPTPRRSDGDGGPNPLTRAERMDDVETRVIRLGGRWGKYAHAIERWEHVTRPAPDPTELSRKGNRRLSPAFSEWMMGWPPGWVTDVDVSRNAQLRIIGNGVVPQQAVAALRWLFSIQAVAA